MLSPFQQALELIQKSRNILIALPENLNGDSLGSSLALQSALAKTGKKIDVVCQEPPPEKLKFLAGLATIKNKLSSWRDFIISIDTSQNKISRLRYETEQNVLKIFLTTPQKVEQRDIKLDLGQFYYDLIITLDAPDLESLGKIFEENTELFFSKPVLNIDHKAANEFFGEVNLVEPTSAACAEVVAKLIEALGLSLAEEESATALLTGLIEKTRSFQNSKTTPQVLNLASLLIAKGAEQEKIIRHLYKTKPLNAIKLWGRLLSRLDYDETKNIAWLSAEPSDFSSTETSSKDLPFILDEISDLFPQLNLIFILWRENGGVRILAQARQEEILQRINLEIPGTVKNSRLLVKTAESDISGVKEKITGLLNSLG